MTRARILSLHVENFTAFGTLDVDFHRGINILVGTNGTGKTHLLKLVLLLWNLPVLEAPFLAKLERIFLPYQGDLRRLLHGNSTRSIVQVRTHPGGVAIQFGLRKEDLSVVPTWQSDEPYRLRETPCVFIPSKEILANAPGFRSLYNLRNIHFEAVYAELLDWIYLDPLRENNLSPEIRGILARIENALDGRVTRKGEHLFLAQSQKELEFTLLAEGIRKLGLLWLLLTNGGITPGSVLLWDEPEANLNPSLMGTVIQILIELQRLGVQIFLATHNYFVLKEFDLRRNAGDEIGYHSLYHDPDTGEIRCQTTGDFDLIEPNIAVDTMESIYDREVERALDRTTS